MPGALKVWPDWPEFTEKTAELKPEYAGFKRDIVNEYGEAAIKEAWVKVCGELERLTDEIADKGTSMIPVVEFSEVEKGLTEERKKELGDIGCFVVRGVVPEEEVNGLFKDLKTYVGDNKAHIGGWPKETPFVLRLFWSKTQVSLRTHPKHLLLQRALNSFWHDDSPSPEIPDFTEPLAYADAVRIRPPKIPFFGLGPHIDAGSLCRWADPTYRSAYGKIFSGKPEEHDCYDLGARKTANQVLFDGGAHSSVLRAFQGWTALTGAGPREGSLLLYPNVKTVVAYLLLRPFFKEPGDEVQGEEERLKPENWTFDTESQWFPGTWQADSQLLSPGSHPHLRLRECMVNIPRMSPGDSIWWHCDMCHAVEVEHNGDNDASVAYIAATPSTIENIRYMKGQLQDFIKGVAPGDYDAETPEKQFKGFKGEEAILSGDVGRRAMGFGL